MDYFEYDDEGSSSPLTELSPYARELKKNLEVFVRDHCYPAEEQYEEHMSKRSGKDRWTKDAVPPIMQELKKEAMRQGLWNMFLPHEIPKHLIMENPILSTMKKIVQPRQILSNREYGVLCEVTGRSFLCPEACNCSAPDTGNMEVLLKHGTKNQQLKYLPDLLLGNIRSTFLMTEPDVASSDATNIQTTLTKKISPHNNKISYVLNGKKWWSTGAMDPRCKVALVLARMDYSDSSCPKDQNDDDEKHPKHGAHTVVVIPMNTPGVKLVRPLTVFGYDDAPHGHAEVLLDNVICGEDSLVLGEGKGFQIAQSRLGPGRIHHCMRAVGLAARCYELMLSRSMMRKTFGKYLIFHGGCQDDIAQSKIDLESARLLTLQCAHSIDAYGAKAARDQIALIKVAVPNLTIKVIDRAVQVFGGAGVSQDFVLARALAGMRTLRIADGPDAVHRRTLALLEARKRKQLMSRL